MAKTNMSIKHLVILVVFMIGGTSVLAQALPTPEQTLLQSGVPIVGSLDAENETELHYFRASVGDDVVILMESLTGNLDPFLALRAPSGALLAENDDIEEGVILNARITLDDAPEDGIYVIEAFRLPQLGDSTRSGTYQLTLTVTGSATQPDLDPFSREPLFDVQERIQYGARVTGTLNTQTPPLRYVFQGLPGDLVDVVGTVSEGDLTPELVIRDETYRVISTSTPTPPDYRAVALIPQRGWYLLEVNPVSGAGTLTLRVQALAGQTVSIDDTQPLALEGPFTVAQPSSVYLFEGKIGTQLFIRATTQGATTPALTLLDTEQRVLATNTSTTRLTSINALLPRTQTYILKVSNTTLNTVGSYNLQLTDFPLKLENFATREATYNNAYRGFLDALDPVHYYRFSGKASELVTIQMNTNGGNLDPFLALYDGNLRELVSSDNVLGSLNAGITQYRLEADGTYYLLVGRSGLGSGTTEGQYTFAFSAGAVTLTAGALSAKLEWDNDSDLNLFIREPSGRIISWSNPNPEPTVQMQIDSNTACETISTDAVEYIYWNADAPPTDGEYQVWVWYQRACMSESPTTFTLTLSQQDQLLQTDTATLNVGERWNRDVRVVGGQSFALGDGFVTVPTPQQIASEGGDALIVYGQTLTGTLSDAIYANFYQFTGRRGETILIEAKAVTGDLDPLVILRDNQEVNLATNDDADPATKDARLEYTLPTTGRHVIAVTRYGVREGLTSGGYELTLTRANAP